MVVSRRSVSSEFEPRAFLGLDKTRRRGHREEPVVPLPSLSNQAMVGEGEGACVDHGGKSWFSGIRCPQAVARQAVSRYGVAAESSRVGQSSLGKGT